MQELPAKTTLVSAICYVKAAVVLPLETVTHASITLLSRTEYACVNQTILATPVKTLVLYVQTFVRLALDQLMMNVLSVQLMQSL